jgi:hypothetical protein
VPNTAMVTTSSRQLRGSMRTLGSTKNGEFYLILCSKYYVWFDSLLFCTTKQVHIKSHMIYNISYFQKPVCST